MTLQLRWTKTALPAALATLLLASGCKSNNQQPPAQPTQQGQLAPNQPGQQSAPPPQQGYAPQQQQQPNYAPERENRRERRREGYAPAPGQQGYAPAPGQQGYAPERQQPAYAPAPQRSASVIPAGTHLVVTLGETISSKTAQPGDGFAATVVSPVVVNGVTLVRAGATANGTVVDAKALGRFKGGAVLSIRLDTVHAEGRNYQVASSTVERVEQGKGKRTGILTGGGAGLGALIGGLAGGGKGALIGGLAGAGAGGAGSAFTGNKELVIPAETQLTFRIERDVVLQ